MKNLNSKSPAHLSKKKILTKQNISIAVLILLLVISFARCGILQTDYNTYVRDTEQKLLTANLEKEKIATAESDLMKAKADADKFKAELDASLKENETLKNEKESLTKKIAELEAAPSPQPSVTTAPEKSSQKNNFGSVYYTDKGKKYHSNPNCSNMKNPVATSEANAIGTGRTKCSKCW